MNRIGYLGLGSNLGDRLSAIWSAAEALDNVEGVTMRRVATVLETVPIGVDGHAPYLNTVLEIETTRTPIELLEECLAVERSLGRIRMDDQECHPRQLDIDLLLLGDMVVESSGVSVPHPRMHLRAFVLVPMVELAPDFVHPVLGRSMDQLLQEEIELHGPVADRCAILRPGPLLDDGPMTGPAGLPSS